MFYDDPRCTKLADRIFIYKNIIPKDILEDLQKDLNDFKIDRDENYWSVRNWYKDKMTKPYPSTFKLWKFMSELIYPEIVLHPVRNFMVSQPDDDGMFVHTDSPGKDKCDLLLEIDQWSTCCDLEYGMIAYTGEFTGGALYYPNINPDGTEKTGDMRIDAKKLYEPCFEVQPEPGDIVLHGACVPYDHGVREVNSGIRFAFSCFSLLAKDNPGTFYNYKSPEWYQQIGNIENPNDEQLNEWNTPLKLNPQFIDEIDKRTKLLNESKGWDQ